MSVSERRIARRFILNVPLQLLPIKAPSQAARTVETMNISTRGVYFTTDLPLCPGQLVQVLLQMPKEITGNVSARGASRAGSPTWTRMRLQTGCQEWACNFYITGSS